MVHYPRLETPLELKLRRLFTLSCDYTEETKVARKGTGPPIHKTDGLGQMSSLAFTLSTYGSFTYIYFFIVEMNNES